MRKLFVAIFLTLATVSGYAQSVKGIILKDLQRIEAEERAAKEKHALDSINAILAEVARIEAQKQFLIQERKKAVADSLARIKAEQERIEAERLAVEHARQKAVADSIATVIAEAERLEIERLKAEKIRQKEIADSIAADTALKAKQEAERLKAEKIRRKEVADSIAADKTLKAKLEAERIAAEKAHQKEVADSISAVRAEEARIEATRLKAEKKARRDSVWKQMPIAWQKGAKLRFEVGGGAGLMAKQIDPLAQGGLFFDFAVTKSFQIGVGSYVEIQPVSQVDISILPCLDIRGYLIPDSKKARLFLSADIGYGMSGKIPYKLYKPGLYDEVKTSVETVDIEYGSAEVTVERYYAYREFTRFRGPFGKVGLGIELERGFLIGVSYVIGTGVTYFAGCEEWTNEFGNKAIGEWTEDMGSRLSFNHVIMLNLGWNIPLAKSRK